MKILNNDTYLLLIDEEAEVFRGQYRLLNDKVELIHEGHNYPYKGFKIIAYYPLNSEAKELDLPKLPPFENEVYIQELAKEEIKFNHKNIKEKHEIGYRIGFEQGYKAAQQSNKQFSLEDILKFRKVLEEGALTNMSCASAIVEFDRFIQSLSTQQFPKEFKPIMVCGRCLKPDDNDEDCWSAKECSRNTDFPDTLKTITNPDGREEIQGTYRY